MLTNEELDSLRAEKVVYDPAWTEVFEQAKEANTLRTMYANLEVSYHKQFAEAKDLENALRREVEALRAKAALADEVYRVMQRAELQDDGSDYESAGCAVFEMTVEYRRDYIRRYDEVPHE